MKEEWRNWNGWGFMVSLNLKFRVPFGNIVRGFFFWSDRDPLLPSSSHDISFFGDVITERTRVPFWKRNRYPDKLSTNRQILKSSSACGLTFYPPSSSSSSSFLFSQDKKKLGSNLKSPLILPVIKKLALVEKKGGEKGGEIIVGLSPFQCELGVLLPLTLGHFGL